MPVLSFRILRAAGEPGLVARAAYGGRRRLYDRASARTYDFSRRPGLAWSEIALPAGVPRHLIDPEGLWNAVAGGAPWGRAELAREIIMGLPRGRPLSAHALLVRGFAEEAFVWEGRAVDWSLHYDREWNLHAHALISPPWIGDEDGHVPEGSSFPGMSPGALRALWLRHCARQGLVDGVTPRGDGGVRPAAVRARERRGVMSWLGPRRRTPKARAGRPFQAPRPPWLRVRWRRREREMRPRAPRGRLGRGHRTTVRGPWRGE